MSERVLVRLWWRRPHPWRDRQRRRWRALSWEQRKALNAEGKGWNANRWPYHWAPWVPRGVKPEPSSAPLPLEVAITADTRAFEEAVRKTSEAFDHFQASVVEAVRKRREIEGRTPLCYEEARDE